MSQRRGSIRPAEVSPRMWREFTRYFQHGQGFWTSEDGNLMSFVILRVPDAMEILKREHAYDFDRYRFAPLKERYAFKEWTGGEFFDGGSGTNRGKVWRCTDEPTPFPVYELEIL